MTDKELRKLNRAELLELLILQTKQLDELELERNALKKELERRRLDIAESGTLAEAALRLNDVFRNADKAVQEYVEQAKSRADAMLADTENRCEARKLELEAYEAQVYERLRSCVLQEQSKLQTNPVGNEEEPT